MGFELFKNLHPVLQALLATTITWLLTAFGASFVFFAKSVNRKLLDGMLGFASGVMISASYWSLLEPAIEMSKDGTMPQWSPPAIGFLTGAIFLRLLDKILPHLHIGFSINEAEGIKTSLRRTTLLVLAVALHNIPEGLAVGVAFGAGGADMPSVTLMGAIILTIGIGLHNIPEGMAVSMPLRSEGVSRWKSFWYGQLSAMIEPIAAVIGAATVSMSQAILPYAYSFAAGAMIFIVVEELIPTSQRSGNTDIATMGTILGFILMMSLVVGFR